jgi:hypothetical protein
VETRHFAWWPRQVTSNTWVWLRYYYQHKSLYDTTTGRPPLNGLYFVWAETHSERVWRLLQQRVVENRNVWNDPSLTKKDIIK